jgi:hypothetical protein
MMDSPDASVDGDREPEFDPYEELGLIEYKGGMELPATTLKKQRTARLDGLKKDTQLTHDEYTARVKVVNASFEVLHNPWLRKYVDDMGTPTLDKAKVRMLYRDSNVCTCKIYEAAGCLFCSANEIVKGFTTITSVPVAADLAARVVEKSKITTPFTSREILSLVLGLSKFKTFETDADFPTFLERRVCTRSCRRSRMP